MPRSWWIASALAVIRGISAWQLQRPTTLKSASRLCARWMRYGALEYLRQQPSILKDRIGVQGWSNGGMTVLATMSDQSPGLPLPGHQPGFRAAIAEYPGCGMDAIKGIYHAYAPILMMLAGDDEEVSPQRCEEFAKKARNDGDDLKVVVYPGASHNFDDPSQSKQSNPQTAKQPRKLIVARRPSSRRNFSSEPHPKATEAFSRRTVQPALIRNSGGVLKRLESRV